MFELINSVNEDFQKRYLEIIKTMPLENLLATAMEKTWQLRALEQETQKRILDFKEKQLKDCLGEVKE